MVNAYQMGRAHARAGTEKTAAGLASFPRGPVLPRLLTALGRKVRRGLWHLDPSLVPTMRARNLGAVTAGLGAGTLGAMMSGSDQPPQPPGIPQGYLPPGIQ